VSGAVPELRTARLVLRAWRDDDFAPFAALNADPVVMEHFPSVLTRAESDAMADSLRTELAHDGLGLWAVEVPGVAPFVGFIGLARPAFDAHFTPAVEIGWRLAREAWGKGYATEGARAALDFGFATAGLDEIVSFTTAGNARSRRVMERLGLRHDPADDFDHPRLPKGHRLRHHVLYRIDRATWKTSRA
jgi:RimJ/RimL family protein N-acetyltransferase